MNKFSQGVALGYRVLGFQPSTAVGAVAKIVVRHSERSAAESKNPVKLPEGSSAGFDSLTSRSLSLRPSRPCRGFPSRSILDFARDDNEVC